jgi:hypothetical protein
MKLSVSDPALLTLFQVESRSDDLPRYDAVELVVALDISVVDQLEGDLILEAGLLDDVLGILKLLLRQGDASVAAPGSAHQLDGQSAPAAANLQHLVGTLHPRLNT